VQIEGRRKIIGNWKILEFETGKGLRIGPTFQNLDGLCSAVGQNKSEEGLAPAVLNSTSGGKPLFLTCS